MSFEVWPVSETAPLWLQIYVVLNNPCWQQWWSPHSPWLRPPPALPLNLCKLPRGRSIQVRNWQKLPELPLSSDQGRFNGSKMRMGLTPCWGSRWAWVANRFRVTDIYTPSFQIKRYRRFKIPSTANSRNTNIGIYPLTWIVFWSCTESCLRQGWAIKTQHKSKRSSSCLFPFSSAGVSW